MYKVYVENLHQQIFIQTFCYKRDNWSSKHFKQIWKVFSDQ